MLHGYAYYITTSSIYSRSTITNTLESLVSLGIPHWIEKP